VNDYIVRDLLPNRKYVRLPEHDYSSAGVYFVTICALNKQCLFGEIKNAAMRPNPYGKIVQQCWNDIPKHYFETNNEIFSLMPNHVHGIIIIPDDDGRSGLKPDPTNRHTLPEIIRAFKTFSAKGINEAMHSPGTPIWQRSFYEHIIRTEKEYREIGEYIYHNPQKWDSDTENPNTG
jgi:REP element-mobilizing transposase RayT